MTSICPEGLLRTFARDERGATAIEYTLIAAMVAIGIVASVEDLGTTLAAIYAQAAALLDAV